MFKFAGKNILIISPQPWTHHNISKHHYAKELSLRNKVWFINAPEKKWGFHFSIKKIIDYPNLSIISYSIPLPYFFFFHVRSWYKKINVRIVAKRLREITPEFDLCIDFGNYLLYENADFVNAKLKLYFPVDDFENLQPSMRGSAFAFSVSNNIVAKFTKQGLTCHFINHGLSKEFADFARLRLINMKRWQRGENLNVGYAGNLFIPFIYTEPLKKIITNYPEVIFHFFGSTNYDKTISWQAEWYEFLVQTKNVKLYGSLNTAQLTLAFANMDAFLLSYKPDNKNYHAENSHKIIEYLSTGRVIISTPITLYKQNKLFCMCDEHKDFEQTFNMVLKNMESYNSIVYAKERILLSLDNEYVRQIERIESIINLSEGSRNN
ncbi:MAG: hypothetical protein KF746_21995 [Chitinophagaceae bacterium]|nr:hypothetical protein [Chitinophagaceae bacterium]